MRRKTSFLIILSKPISTEYCAKQDVIFTRINFKEMDLLQMGRRPREGQRRERGDIKTVQVCSAHDLTSQEECNHHALQICTIKTNIKTSQA